MTLHGNNCSENEQVVCILAYMGYIKNSKHEKDIHLKRVQYQHCCHLVRIEKQHRTARIVRVFPEFAHKTKCIHP